MASQRYQCAKIDPTPLSQPLQFPFSSRTAKNRILKAATTERIASWDVGSIPSSGLPTAELINVYRRWGEGGYGIIVSGNILIANDHLEAAGNMIIDNGPDPVKEERLAKFRKLAEAGQAHGSLMIGQLNHPGRQTRYEFQKDPVAPSAIKLKDTLGMQFGQPHEATEKEIQGIIDAFVNAALLLEKAGWDGVQIHAAHGYLLAQFMSPTTNKRTDRYGGSFENRTRIIVDTILAVRARVSSSFIISIKINSVEFQDGGFTTDEASQLCVLLEQKARVDFVEISGGTYEQLAFDHKRETTKKREAFFLDFAEQIVPALKISKVFITGGFKTVKGMVDALQTLDGVGVARTACQEFGFAQAILNGSITGAIQQKLDDQNFMITNVAAGTQIGQVGRDQDPIDLSRQENVDAFMKDLSAWMVELQQDVKLEMAGFINLQSVQAQPYGTAVI